MRMRADGRTTTLGLSAKPNRRLVVERVRGRAQRVECFGLLVQLRATEARVATAVRLQVFAHGLRVRDLLPRVRLRKRSSTSSAASERGVGAAVTPRRDSEARLDGPVSCRKSALSRCESAGRAVE